MVRGTPLVAVAGLAGLMLVADARAADLEAGRAVVVGGKESSVTPCFMCHGLDGVGDSAGAFPRLTGQAAFYMYKQLIDYASGARPNDVMTPIARAMTEAQMADVAYYYSVVDAPFAPPPAVDPDLLERGRAARRGRARRGGRRRLQPLPRPQRHRRSAAVPLPRRPVRALHRAPAPALAGGRARQRPARRDGRDRRRAER